MLGFLHLDNYAASLYFNHGFFDRVIIFPWAIAGFFVTIWIAAVMFKSNDILKKQTALKVLNL